MWLVVVWLMEQSMAGAAYGHRQHTQLVFLGQVPHCCSMPSLDAYPTHKVQRMESDYCVPGEGPS